MNPQSVLQQQFPLSPRKFLKKMLGQIIGVVISGLFVGPLFSWVFYAAANDFGSSFSVGGYILLALVIFVVWGCLFIIPYALYIKAYIRRYYYSGEENFVTIKKGVFAPAEIHVQYQKVQDVYVDQDIMDRMLGLYDVHIASATVSSGIEAHIDGVDQAAAEGLKEFLLNKIQGKSWSGANAPASAGQQTQASAGPTVAKFSEEISSKTYPITGRWVAVQALKYVLTSLIYTLIILSWIATNKDGGSSILQSMGYADAGSIFFIGFLIFAVFYILHNVYIILWKSNYDFKFMPEYIFLHTGIIAKSEKHVPYNTLQDVTVSQGVIERMFGLASVMIENAANNQMRVGRNGRPVFNGITIPGQTPANAQKITEALKAVILTKPARSGTGL